MPSPRLVRGGRHLREALGMSLTETYPDGPVPLVDGALLARCPHRATYDPRTGRMVPGWKGPCLCASTAHYIREECDLPHPPRRGDRVKGRRGATPEHEKWAGMQPLAPATAEEAATLAAAKGRVRLVPWRVFGRETLLMLPEGSVVGKDVGYMIHA